MSTASASDPVYNLKTIRGINQNPTFDAEKFESIIDNFERKDGDVFIATYVKAGTTWVQTMVHGLLRSGEPGGFYAESVPWLEALSSDILSSREAPTWDLQKFGAAAAPRYFKTHATVRQLPGAGAKEAASAKIKVIYVARNPKDTCVSLYHHAKSKPEFGFNGDFAAFYKIFVEGGAENGCWFAHVLEWHSVCQAEPESHIFLQYEAMYKQPVEAIRLIANFLGLATQDAVVLKVAEQSGLEQMKQGSIGFNHIRKGQHTSAVTHLRMLPFKDPGTNQTHMLFFPQVVQGGGESTSPSL